MYAYLTKYFLKKKIYHPMNKNINCLIIFLYKTKVHIYKNGRTLIRIHAFMSYNSAWTPIKGQQLKLVHHLLYPSDYFIVFLVYLKSPVSKWPRSEVVQVLLQCCWCCAACCFTAKLLLRPSTLLEMMLVGISMYKVGLRARNSLLMIYWVKFYICIYLKLTYTHYSNLFSIFVKKKNCFHLSQAIQFLLLILDFFLVQKVLLYLLFNNLTTKKNEIVIGTFFFPTINLSTCLFVLLQ